MSKQHNSGFIKIVEEAKSRIQELTIADLNEKISKGAVFYLIDVRELPEYQQGSITQAIHLSKGIIERDIEKWIPDYEAEIVVFCSGGFRSSLVADNLKKMGYQHVASLQGGLSAWSAAGYLLCKNTA